jgi:hypothetical protein
MIIGLSVISQQRIYQKFLDGFNDDDDKDNIVVEKADNEKEGLSSKIVFQPSLARQLYLRHTHEI